MAAASNQNHNGDEGAHMEPCHSPHLHPQIQASEDGARASCRCGDTSPTASAALPDDDNMLREILICLPSQPSSLPRVSVVCKRWHGIVTDPGFITEFYAHHRKPPILGVFEEIQDEIVFNPVLDSPDRIPPQRFNLGLRSDSRGYNLLDCRHGHVLIEEWMRKDVLVCNPITGKQRRVAIPLEFRRSSLHGAVFCAAADHGHIHGGCHSSPFKVVLVSTARTADDRCLFCIYSSETSLWGNVISIKAQSLRFYDGASLIGNCLYWLSYSHGILEFDLNKNSLTLITEPPVTNNMIITHRNRQIIQSENGVVGFAILCYPHIHMCRRNFNGNGVTTWTPWKNIEIYRILGRPRIEELVGRMPSIRGYDEDTDTIFVQVRGIVYMVHLKSMQSRKLYETAGVRRCHPFKSFYTPGDAKGCCS